MLKTIRIILQAIGLLTLLCVAVGMAVVPYWSDWLQIADEPEKADYIVVLDGDGHRLLKATELFKQDFAPTILLSNAYQRPTSRLDNLAVELGYPEIKPHEFRSRVLQHFGVPPEAIAEFGNGHISTLEEAEALKQFLGARAIRAILVTSPYHARRAKLTFKSVMPQAHFVVVCPPEGRIDPHWWRDQQSALTTLNETAKLFYFWLGGAFRVATDGRPIGSGRTFHAIRRDGD
jgi:uncharacterized SAM-binding protein YcdF (DUF218 family)